MAVRFGHRVHCRADQRHVQLDSAGEDGRHVSVFRHKVRRRRQQKHVIEGQTFGDFSGKHARAPLRVLYTKKPISPEGETGFLSVLGMHGHCHALF